MLIKWGPCYHGTAHPQCGWRKQPSDVTSRNAELGVITQINKIQFVVFMYFCFSVGGSDLPGFSYQHMESWP
jgi:hypothetical protein